MTGRNAMEIMLNREKVTRWVQKKQSRMIIAAMQWTLLIIVITGKDKILWGKVKRSTHSAQVAKYYDKIT